MDWRIEKIRRRRRIRKERVLVFERVLAEKGRRRRRRKRGRRRKERDAQRQYVVIGTLAPIFLIFFGRLISCN